MIEVLMHLLTKVRLLLINEFSLVGCDAGIALIVGFSEASLAAFMTIGATLGGVHVIFVLADLTHGSVGTVTGLAVLVALCTDASV